MERRTMDAGGSLPLSGRPPLVRAVLILITSLSLAELGSPADQHERSSLPIPDPPNPSKSKYISYNALPGINTTRPSRNGHGDPFALPNNSWVNSGKSGISVIRYDDGSVVRPLLVQGSSGPSFACGFFCRETCNAALFSIFLIVTDGSSAINSSSPQVVWSANRNNPVGEGARLNLTSDGDLVLLDSNGTVAWSTGTSQKSVAGVTLTETGNLVLYSSMGRIVWQSFDHATDTVLTGQSVAGQRLVANASATSSKEGKYYLNVTDHSLYAFFETSDTPGMFFSGDVSLGTRLRVVNGTLLPILRVNAWYAARNIHVNPTHQFIRMEHDGHLKLHRWLEEEMMWKEENDLFTEGSGNNSIGQCIYPNFCGEYGICSPVQPWPQCSCPADYFKPVDPRKLNKGCYPVVDLSCPSADNHTFIPLADISYSGYVRPADLMDTDVDSCKKACLGNCSCKAAFFKRGVTSSKGDCYLPSHILSMYENRKSSTGYTSSAFIKVQSSTLGGAWQPGAGERFRTLAATLGALFTLLLLCIIVAAGIVLRRKRNDKDVLEGCLPHLPGMPSRFSYRELKAATWNFSTLLGKGGFGSVFLGILPADGVTVAVKLLGGKGHQGMKEFLAEVETIGSIHHVNLVRLVGYCAHKLHRLLIYEYMCNGSLDKWIFHPEDDNPKAVLDWRTRHKIILHVAKGLAYLHEECRHRIAHLDIKPENILLDERFNAKVSDFGLCKLIDLEQSHVMTTMRGTLGYLAPEWLSSMITEKVDVFSFGVLVLETVCGRRNIDPSRPKQGMTLVNEVKSAAAGDRLPDIVDSKCEGIEYYLGEAITMVRTALWCLQGDPHRRPPMSAVVKVLEGVTDIIQPSLDSIFTAPTPVLDHGEVNYFSSSTPMQASTLSQPR